MAEVKLTKNELRLKQTKLQQLTKYLPTLQLKKAMLQHVVFLVKEELTSIEQNIVKGGEELDQVAPLFAENQPFDIAMFIEVAHMDKSYENIAGVEVPQFQEVFFKEKPYSLLSTPVWFCQGIAMVKKVKALEIERSLVLEKKKALEEELRQVSIRVNLFEKVLIPRHVADIKRIRIFLDDLSLSAISMAKSAKNLLEKKRRGERA